VTARPRLRGAFFDALYARERDPWDFEASPYERAKYDRTVAAIAHRRWGRALEVGCSIGVLTAHLAEHCDELCATDVAQAAVDAARARLCATGHVSVRRAEFPEELPAGPWDLIVCSEVLYYLDRPTLGRAVDACAGALAPGGALVAVHWRHSTQRYPLRGDEVHALLEERLDLRHVHAEATDDYRLDRWEAAT